MDPPSPTDFELYQNGLGDWACWAENCLVFVYVWFDYGRKKSRRSVIVYDDILDFERNGSRREPLKWWEINWIF